MDIFLNPWVVGIGTSVVAGLILYYIFGVGKDMSNDKKSSLNKQHFDSQQNPKQREYEIELESFRNDMVRRGLAHSSIRRNGEDAIRAKFGIPVPVEDKKGE